eukprot:GDKI01024559.1.p1 GENE.GDKI01024559.1~~GDKI01024559.1.p1  ORF type:complete len:241 (-),score=112.40 GDKI01024559.1:254-901(-)
MALYLEQGMKVKVRVLRVSDQKGRLRLQLVDEPKKLKGTKQLREEMRRKLQLAVELEALVKKDERFELVVPRTFGLVCLRIKGMDNAAQERLLEAVNSAPENFFIIHTKVADMFVVRVACSSLFADESHVNLLWSVIQRETQKIIDTHTHPTPGAATAPATAPKEHVKLRVGGGKKLVGAEQRGEEEEGEIVQTPDGPMRVVCDGDVCRMVPVEK